MGSGVPRARVVTTRGTFLTELAPATVARRVARDGGRTPAWRRLGVREDTARRGPAGPDPEGPDQVEA